MDEPRIADSRNGGRISGMIRPLRIVLVGGVCGLAAGLLSLVVEFAIVSARIYADDSGGLGAVSAHLYAPSVAIIGFVVGAVWQLRRGLATRR